MTLLEAIALGIVQGLTEFFPISSSGHLVLAQELLGVNLPGVAFEVLVHLATLVSVLILYRRRLVELLSGVARADPDALGYVGMLAVASLPAAVVGNAFAGPISRTFERPLVAAVSLLVTGVIVYVTRWVRDRGAADDPGWRGSLGVGVAQAFALFPGISRSGVTLTAALTAGTRPDKAAEFCFLLAVPAILGASVQELPEMMATDIGIGAAQLIAASLSAIAAGLAAILLFVRWLRAGSFHRFAYYCWVVGSAYILYSLSAG